MSKMWKVHTKLSDDDQTHKKVKYFTIVRQVTRLSVDNDNVISFSIKDHLSSWPGQHSTLGFWFHFIDCEWDLQCFEMCRSNVISCRCDSVCFRVAFNKLFQIHLSIIKKENCVIFDNYLYFNVFKASVIRSQFTFHYKQVSKMGEVQ